MFALSNGRRSQIIRRLHWTALALFIASLALPAVSGGQFFHEGLICKDPPWMWGWFWFLVGPSGLFDGQYGWFANPLMLLASLMHGRSALTRALTLGSASTAVLLVVVTPFAFTSFWIDGGGPGIVCGFGPGYYLWLTSSVLVLIASLLKPSAPQGLDDRAEPVGQNFDARHKAGHDV